MAWGPLDMQAASGFLRNVVYPTVVFPAGSAR
jgi:hypothetical protein